MPDKDNFLAVLDPVGTLDCSCGGDKLQVQHAVFGHLIPIVDETPLLHQSVIGSLCASDARQVQNQMVNQDKFIVCERGRSLDTVAIQGNLIGRDAGGPQGVGCSTEDTMYTLTRGDVHGVAIPIDGRNALRNPDKLDSVNRQGFGVGEPGDPAHTVTTACVHAVAIPIQDGRGMEKRQNGFGVGADADPAYTLDTTGAQSVCIGLNSEMNAVNDGIGTLRRGGQGGIQEVVAFSSNMSAPDVREDGCSPCLKLGGHGGSNPPAIAFKPGQSSAARSDGVSFDCAPTLEGGGGGNNKPAVCPSAMVVRRLLPVECERLQGFPDGWTAVPHKGKPAADGPRYKALGNSMAVPCMRWIGERIKALEEGRL